MVSNLAIFHAVDLTIIVGGIALCLWKYGQVRVGATEGKEKIPVFLLNLSLMMHFWLHTGTQAFLPGRTLDFYLSLVGAGATSVGVVYIHLRLVQNLAQGRDASAADIRDGR